VTVDTALSASRAQRLGRLEDPTGDFPFYNGAPIGLSGKQWALVMAAVVVAFLVLVVPMPWPGGPIGALLPALLFPALPLLALSRVAPGHWRRLFGRVGVRELRLMVGFALLNIVISLIVGGLVGTMTEVSSNAAIGQLAAMATWERVAFFAKTLPQLLGEELLTVLPFLALMAVLPKWTGVGRRGAIVGAWIASSVLFGLIHLPTYDWNWLQCIAIIGTARLVLTLPWILTKNLWVSTGAHILNDWLLFAAAVLGAGLAGKA